VSRSALAGHNWHSQLAGIFPVLLLAASSLIILPVFVMGLPCSHDAFIHLSRAAEVFFNARGGSPFLQWSPDLMRGYGHPVLAFYAPLAYWLLAAPRWLGVSFGTAFRGLAYLSLPVGGIGIYVLGRRYLSVPAAFVAGLTYLFAPYLLFDAIQRGALPETVAMGLLPYCLVAAGAAARKRTARRVVAAGLLLSVLISLHNLVPLFAVPLCLLVAAFEGLGSQTAWERRAALGEAWRGLLAGAVAIGLAILVSTSIWLPAIVEVKQTLTGQPTAPASADLSNWPRYYANLIPAAELIRWPSEPGDWQLYNAPISRSLGLVPAILAALALLALLHPAAWRRYPVQAALGLAALVTLFLSSQPSRWLWDHSRQLQVVQLPTRFLGPTNIGVALLCGLLVELLVTRASHPATRAAAVALPAIAIAVCGWPWLFPSYCEPPVLNSPAGIAQPKLPNTWMYEPVGELLPQWVQALPPEQPLTDQYKTGQAVNRLTWPAEQVIQTSWQTRPGYDRYELQATQTTRVTYQTFYFPGWQASLDGRPIELRPSSADGLITLDLPAGRHVLEIAFRRTPLRSISLLVSGAGLALCLVITVRGGSPALPAPVPPSAVVIGKVPMLLGSTTVALLALFFFILPRFNTPFLGRRLSGESLAGVQHPASVAFEQEIRYLGYHAPTQVRADQSFELVQYWKPEHKLGVPYALAARLVDDQDHGWNLPSDRPFDYGDYLGSESWPADIYLRDAYVMHLLPGTPPGRYWLEVNVFRRDTSLQLVPEPGTLTGPDPAWARVGQIEILPPASSNWPQDPAVDTVQSTPLGGGLSLAGWSLPRAQVLAGDVAHITLLWQSSLRQAAPGTLRGQLLDGGGQAIADFPIVPGGSRFPVDQWPGSALVRDQVDWRVPSTTGSGGYQVVVINGPVTANLGDLQVSAPEHQFERPALPTSVDQNLGFARLVGYSLSASNAKPGGTLSLTVVWQAIADAADSYRVFVHLRGANGSPIAQSDTVPAQWQRPTSGWVPGEFIVDPHTLTLPADAASGTYSLVVGLYKPSDGTRLGEIRLTTIKVP
jgi:hypothetical protein